MQKFKHPPFPIHEWTRRMIQQPGFSEGKVVRRSLKDVRKNASLLEFQMVAKFYNRRLMVLSGQVVILPHF